jgi:hypothetical protein
MFMCRKGKFNFIYKVLTAIIAGGSILFLPFISFAQSGGDLPCQDQDPTSSPCPFDTWVWILVLGGAIFGTLQLYYQQKVRNRAKTDNNNSRI